MLGGAASAKTASYTLVSADAGTAISMSNAGATTITVNTALFAAGDTVQITNLGAGVCTITAGTATVNSSGSLALAQYESGTLNFTSTSAAIFIKGAGAGGGLTLITETVASSNTGIDFTSITGSYKQLLLTWCGLSHSATGSVFYLRFNSNTSAVYAISQTGDATSQDIYSTRGAGYNVFGQNSSSTSIEKTLYGSILIDNYSSSSKAKFFEVNHNIYDNLYASVIIRRSVGWFNDATAITSLNIVRDGGSATLSNAANTSIRLYGIS